eukprot:5885080-Prymnesium_polylepis.1
MTTLDTYDVDRSTIDNHGLGCTPLLWQVLQASADAAPAPQMPSMHEAALKSQSANAEWFRTERMEPLIAGSGEKDGAGGVRLGDGYIGGYMAGESDTGG